MKHFNVLICLKKVCLIYFIFSNTALFSKTTPDFENKNELCRIGKNIRNNSNYSSCEKILQDKIPAQHKKHPIIIDGIKIDIPSKLSELPIALNNINFLCTHLLNQQNNWFSFQYEDKLWRLETPFLGIGERGIVFSILGTNTVLKLSKDEIKSLRVLQEERESSNFWYKIGEKNEYGFSVPKKFYTHPLGFFSIMEKVSGETLTEALIRMGLVKANLNNKTAYFDEKYYKSLSENVNIKKINRAITNLILLFKKHPAYKLSISPNNLLITYKDQQKTVIDIVYLIDVGLDSGYSSNYTAVESFDAYLKIAEKKVTKYMRKYPQQFALISNI